MAATFTQASRQHLETLLPLVQSYYQYDHIYFDPPAARAGLTKLLGDPSLGRAWLIHVGDRVAGYFILTFGFDIEFNGRLGTITDLFLLAEFRRQGIGRSAFAFLESACRELDIAAMELQVERHNSQAQAFYRKIGFAELDRITMVKRVFRR